MLGAEFDCLGFRTRIISERLTNLLASKENTIAKRTAVELVGRGFRLVPFCGHPRFNFADTLT